MSKLLALWKRLTDSMWFLPAVLSMAGFALAVLLVRADELVLGDTPAQEVRWLFGGGADGAHGVLGAIAGSIITVTGVVFSVTIVALQLASQQYTPRVLRQFMSDRANQWVLGVFIGTFTYTLVVQRTVHSGGEDGEAFVPAVAITVAFALALVSIGFLIFFIDHAARRIQADDIMARVTRETLLSFRHVAAEGERDVVDEGDIEEPAGACTRIVADRSGYVQAIDDGLLVELAEEHDLVLRVERRVGQFAHRGLPLLSAWGGPPTEKVVRSLCEAFVLGIGRTPHQDPELGIIELVDIAVKALSPGVNDPTTAIMSIDRLAEVVSAMGTGRPAALARRDGEGTVRLVLPRYDFERMVGMAFDQIRHYGVENAAVAVKLLTSLGEVASLVGPDERRVLREAIEHTLTAAEAQVDDRIDLEGVRKAAATALAASGSWTGNGAT